MIPVLVSIGSLLASLVVAMAATAVIRNWSSKFRGGLRAAVSADAAKSWDEAVAMDIELAGALPAPADQPRVLVDRWQSRRAALGIKAGTGRDWEFGQRDLKVWIEREVCHRAQSHEATARTLSALVWGVSAMLALGASASAFWVMGGQYHSP
mgnify:CR=1 FL=1